MASYSFRKVNCIDPCDPNGMMSRNLALLVQSAPAPPNAKTNMSKSNGWQPEPILVNPVKMVDEITANTCIQRIHVIDRVFGNQFVQFIMDQEPLVRFDVSYDKNEISALWPRAIRVPKYFPGQARAVLPYKPGEVKLDGARSDFTASFNAKYHVTEEVPADSVPTYCNCSVRGDDDTGRPMIQCANEQRYCLKEWFHLECIGMAKEDVPPANVDWFCDDCVEGRLGKLRTSNYVPWKSEQKVEAVHLSRKRKGRKKAEGSGKGDDTAAPEKAMKKAEKSGCAVSRNQEYIDMVYTAVPTRPKSHA